MALMEIINSNPKVSIVTFSFVITLAMTLVTKYFTDQTRMREFKIIQKAHQKKNKKHNNTR